ncbi:MAG: bifunctional 5,10-methylenetetrahydrofolate dehydrogenase/5,10-methenyltetrahydrofolate cyclohydrolase [Clostridiales bacterium]|nr:bifunctional 5,10-methylenetetrahydrofolate dehydrogenase/5,10-methenyltetrahydrofolate cyclohydrolase [Clostridiales bacterium]
MAALMKGAACAKAIRSGIEASVELLRAQKIQPGLGILRIGEREDDIAYERSAIKKAEQVGIAVKKTVLPQESTTEQCLQALAALNQDPAVHGILLFRPLPKHIDEDAVIRAMAVEKDIDGMTPGSLAKVFMGESDGFAPCTAEAVVRLLSYEQYPWKGKHAVVLGRSLVVGKPLAMLMLAKNATVTVCHSATENLPEVCAQADLLVAAIGRARMIDKSYIKPGAVVVDVGINVDEQGTLCGDVDTESALERAALVTPVPGGLGAVTSWLLLEHVIKVAERTIR